jgi:hypothetical protein
MTENNHGQRSRECQCSICVDYFATVDEIESEGMGLQRLRETEMLIDRRIFAALNLCDEHFNLVKPRKSWGRFHKNDLEFPACDICESWRKAIGRYWIEVGKLPTKR